MTITNVSGVVDRATTDVATRIGRCFSIVLAAIVWYMSVVRNRATNVDPELTTAFPALVIVEPIIATIRRYGVLKVNRSAEELDRVIGIAKYFDMVNLRAASDTTGAALKRKTKKPLPN